MKTIDKVLIGFLIILLPVGMYFSYRLMGPEKNGSEVTIDAEKLKVMVENYASMSMDRKPKSEIVVTSVGYASESGILTVKGDAPQSSAGIMMSVTVLPAKPSPTPTVEKSKEKLVLGRSVDTKAFETMKDGSFILDYEIVEDAAQVDLRLEQDEEVKTVRFDLLKREQIY